MKSILGWLMGLLPGPPMRIQSPAVPRIPVKGPCDTDCHRDWLYGPCRHEPHDFQKGEVVWIAPEFRKRNTPPHGPYRVQKLDIDGFWDLEYVGNEPSGRDTRARGNILAQGDWMDQAYYTE